MRERPPWDLTCAGCIERARLRVQAELLGADDPWAALGFGDGTEVLALYDQARRIPCTCPKRAARWD